MLDPAILLSLEATVPPQPPVMVQEQILLSPAGEAARRVGQRLADAFSLEADKWIRGLDGIRMRAEPFTLELPADAETIATFDRLVDEYETHADLRARSLARLEKRIRRDVKSLFKVDPSFGAVTRAIGDKIVATDKRVVEAMLDFALFLRALRAEATGEARGGPTFDDPEALKKHLDSLAA